MTPTFTAVSSSRPSQTSTSIPAETSSTSTAPKKTNIRTVFASSMSSLTTTSSSSSSSSSSISSSAPTTSSSRSSVSHSVGVASRTLPKKDKTPLPSSSPLKTSGSTVAGNPKKNSGNEKATLFSILRTNDYEQVKSFLERGGDVNQKDSQGFTPLMTAAERGYLNSMKALIEVGHADVNKPGRDGLTPLHCASRGNSKAGIDYLIERGASIDALDKDLMTALHHAAISGLLDPIRTLAASGAKRNLGDFNKCTALDLFNLFLSQSKSLGHNRDNYDKDTCLEIRILLTPPQEESKPLPKETKEESKPLPNPTKKEATLTSPAKPVEPKSCEGLHRAIKTNNFESVKKGLETGFNPNHKHADGYTFLMCASERGYIESMKALIEVGRADVNKAGKKGLAPMHCAALANSKEAIEYLFHHEADIDAVDDQGLTALHHASGLGLLNSIRTLVALGANTNIKCCKVCKAQTAYDVFSEFLQKNPRTYDATTQRQILELLATK